jgi:hypothetical protein
VHLFSEIILVSKGICRCELSFENLVARFSAEVASTTSSSIGQNYSFCETELPVFIVDSSELDIGDDFVSLTELIELILVYLHVGGVSSWVAPHGEGTELQDDGVVASIPGDL